MTVIDSHGHISAPPQVFAYQARLIASSGYETLGHPKVSAQAHQDALARHLQRLDEQGTDLQLLSPRPYHAAHSIGPWRVVDAWTRFINDCVAAHVSLYPSRFRGVASLPQYLDTSPENCLSELERCVTELGFVGALVNPDPTEGTASNTMPGLGDEFWYPLYEKFCELDVPLYVHSAGCRSERESYSLHFLNEESIAVISLLESDVFQRFPGLRVVVSHGGGAVPFQIGRFRSLRLLHGGEDFDISARKIWYDSCLWSEPAFELLVKVIGPERILYGTETPGTGSGVDPASGKHLDDMLPIVLGSPLLSDAERTAILSENTRRLFKLDLPAAVPAGVKA